MSSQSSNGREVEVDQHADAGRQVSALLSAALAAAQAAAQVSAQRARHDTGEADQQTRHAEQQTRGQYRQTLQADAQRSQLERQHRTEQAVRHRQWGLKPTPQWLHDNPLSAAAAWSSAEVHRGNDPVAARHAEQWETIFQREGVDVDEVRANAPAAVTAAEQEHGMAGTSPRSAEPAEIAGELAAVEVATGAVVAGTVDVAAAEVAEHVHGAAGASRWSAYADGAAAAALGGRGVSSPPNQVLAQARETPDHAATAAQRPRAVELVKAGGVER